MELRAFCFESRNSHFVFLSPESMVQGPYTPPGTPQPFETNEEGSISNECHEADNVQQNGTKTPQTPPATPSGNNVEHHVTEIDKSAVNDTTDHQVNPPLESAKDAEAHTDTNLQDLAVSLSQLSVLSHNESNADSYLERALVAATDEAQSEKAIVKEKEDDLGASKSTSDRTTGLEDATAGFSLMSLEQSGSDYTQKSKRVRVITPNYEPVTKSRQMRCQGTDGDNGQCNLTVKKCKHHPESYITESWEEAIAKHPEGLCLGVTKAKALCRRKAKTFCESHKPVRANTKGDAFREYISTFPSEDKKKYFVTDRYVDITFDEESPEKSREPKFRENLDLDELRCKIEESGISSEVTEITDCISLFVGKVKGKENIITGNDGVN